MSIEPDTVMRFERIDLSELPRAETTAEGFLRVTGRVARTGLQDYRDAKGNVRKELRMHEDVAASVPTFERVPLTNNHPPRMVDPSNAKQYVVGAVGKATIDEDGWVTAPFTIYDASAIAAVRAGRAQLSAGYSCEVVNEPGVHDGTTYDGRQRNIVVNHVAIVDTARAGPDARMRLDSADAEAVTTRFEGDTKPGLASMTERKEKQMPHVLKIDGFTYEVNDANAQASVDRAISAARKDSDEKATTDKTRADNADKLRSDVQKSLSELQGKHDGTLEQLKKNEESKRVLDGVEITFADMRVDAKWEEFLSKVIAKRVDTRANLLNESRKHLGANEKLDGLSDIAIKKLVIVKLAPTAKLDDKDESYVRARYDSEIEHAPKTPTALELVRANMSVSDGRVDAGPSDDPEVARQRMIERQRAAFKK